MSAFHTILLITFCCSGRFVLSTSNFDTIFDAWGSYGKELEEKQNTLLLAKSTSFKKLKDGNMTYQELFQKFMDKVAIILPKADPFNKDRVDFNMDDKLIKFKGFVNNVSLSSFSNFSVHEVQATEDLHIALGLGFEEIQVTGLYDLDFNILTMFPLYGDGDLGLLIRGLNITIAFDFVKDENDILATKNLKLDYGIENVQVSLGGLMGGGPLGDFLNGVISDTAADILNQYKDMVVIILEPATSLGLNNALITYQITLDVIITFMNHIINDF